jgi:thiamine biosynthesis protein ThiI
MFDRAILVHYHEIGLKGRNRAHFENVLKRNIQAVVGGLTEHQTRRIASRLLVRLSDAERKDEIIERVTALPGISYVADAFVTARDLKDMGSAAVLCMREAGEWDSFRVEARRSNTDFPVSSNQINIEVGQRLVDEFGRRVDLTRPDATCFIEVVQGDAYVYSRRLDGPGGLPVGTAGKVVALLSAGIDSPVATWRMGRRGAVVVGLHFSGAPVTDDASVHRAHRIGGILERSQIVGRIYSVAFGEIQRRVSLDAPADLRVLIYRRLMIRVAEALAARERAGALVTGESLGQVASQTLENIAAVDAVATMPVLRPLIGDDKQDIIDEARRIGTYETSIMPGEDCCTLFMPRTPATRATIEEVDEGEAALDIEQMVGDALESLTHRDFECPAYRAPSRRRRRGTDAGREGDVPAAGDE